MRALSATTILCLVATIAALAAPAAAASDQTFAIRAGRIIPVAPDLPATIENGVIIVRNGRIEEIGADLTIPVGMRMIDLPEATIMPGMVAAFSDIAGNHSGDESIGAGYRAIDAFDRYASHASVLEAGITTVHVNPGRHRLLSGQGAVVRLAGPADERALRIDGDVSINLGEPAFAPPDITDLLVPPASDQVITPDQPQRPASRIGQFLALKEAIDKAVNHGGDGGPREYDLHREALAEAWTNERPLRVNANRAEDILGAISFLSSNGRAGYLVGGAQAAAVAEKIAQAELPLVYTLSSSFREPADDIGVDPTAIEPDVRDLVNLQALDLAIATEPGQPISDLRLAAGLALRSGLDEERIIEAITLAPARILGVDDRVGSLAPGKDADMIVLSGRPLETSSHVQRVYVRGELVHRNNPRTNTLIVRAGTIWLGPSIYLDNGSVLIEDGKIVEVGNRVSHPPHARVIDGGADSFLAPGMIDARGHLGLRGDRSGTSPQLSLARLIGLPDIPEKRVARAGVTTVMMTPYNVAGGGSQITAVRTAGWTRDARVIRATAGVAMDVSNVDPSAVAGRLRSRLNTAKRYLDSWREYERELAEWKKKQEEGEEVEREPETVVDRTEETEDDPMSGIWSASVSGGPLPEAATGRLAVRLRGSEFEAQIIEPPAATEVEHLIVGTLEGDRVSGRIEIDTGGMGTPTFEGTLGDERITGTISLAGMSVNFEADRIEKDVETTIVTRRRRVRDEEGRPVPPPIDESLEPLRAVLEKKIPLVIDVRSAAQIRSVLDTLTDDFSVPLILLNADDATVHADELRKRSVGVIPRPQVIRRVRGESHHAAADLARHEISFAFQSAAEDGARALPQVALYAVERGLSAERALAAMTIDAARLFNLEDRIGSISPGLDADMVLYSGHPFELGTTVRRVIINGEDIQP